MRRPRGQVRSVTLGVLPLAAVFLACALGVVWLQITVTKVGYRLSTMQELVQRLEKERQQLRMEIAAVESPAALEEQGRKLGLAPPAWGREVVLP